MSEDLTCALCQDDFNLTLKIPRFFGNCGHTFCSSCIKEIIDEKEEVCCPEDGLGL